MWRPRRGKMCVSAAAAWLAVALAVMTLQAPAAVACSCGDPSIEEAIEAADVSFVGEALSSGDRFAGTHGGDVTIAVLFRVDRVVKGEMGDQALLWAPADGTDGCGGGAFAPGGSARDRPVLVFASATLGRFVAWDACGGVRDPAELDAIAQTPDPATSDRPVALVASGYFGQARLALLDGNGDVVAYATPPPPHRPGSLAPCGEGLVAERRSDDRGWETITVWDIGRLAVVAEAPVPAATRGGRSEFTCRGDRIRFTAERPRREDRIVALDVATGDVEVIDAELGRIAVGAAGDPMGLVGLHDGRALVRLRSDATVETVATYDADEPIAAGVLATASSDGSMATTPDGALLAVRSRFGADQRSVVTLVDLDDGSIVGQPVELPVGRVVRWADDSTLVAPDRNGARWTTIEVDTVTASVTVVRPDFATVARNARLGPVVAGAVYVADPDARSYTAHDARTARPRLDLPAIIDPEPGRIVAVDEVPVDDGVDRTASPMAFPVPGATLPLADDDAVALATPSGSGTSWTWVLLIGGGLAVFAGIIALMARTNRTS